MPPPLFGLPSVKDEWGLTDMSHLKQSSLESFEIVAARANTPEAAEKAVFLAIHEGNVGFEAMAFPWLFPFGTGHFAQERRVDVRLEEYVLHLLEQFSGAYLEDEEWLDFVVSRAAILRFATGLPPIYKEEQEKGGRGMELDASRVVMMKQFIKAFPKESFCVRYLVGDDEFSNLAMLVMYKMTAEERAEVLKHS